MSSKINFMFNLDALTGLINNGVERDMFTFMWGKLRIPLHQYIFFININNVWSNTIQLMLKIVICYTRTRR